MHSLLCSCLRQLLSLQQEFLSCKSSSASKWSAQVAMYYPSAIPDLLEVVSDMSCYLLLQSSSRDCQHKWSATTVCPVPQLCYQADSMYAASCHTVLLCQLLFGAAELLKRRSAVVECCNSMPCPSVTLPSRQYTCSILSHFALMVVAVWCCRAAHEAVSSSGVLQQHA